MAQERLGVADGNSVVLALLMEWLPDGKPKNIWTETSENVE
jgi:hypothetical protein